MSPRHLPTWLVLVVGLAAVAASPVVAAELKEAESLAVHGDRAAAIGAYEALLAEGVDFSGLRYNLGTLYLEEGDVGRAVLHLRTALVDAPGDEDVLHNLDIARLAMKDQLEGVGPGLPLAVALGRQIAPGQATAGFLVPLLLLVLALAGAPWLPLRARRVVLAVAFALFALGGAALGLRLSAEGEVQAVVLEETAARKGPTPAAPESFAAHPGLTGGVRERDGDAVRLRLDNGVEAWIDAKALGFIEVR